MKVVVRDGIWPAMLVSFCYNGCEEKNEFVATSEAGTWQQLVGRVKQNSPFRFSNSVEDAKEVERGNLGSYGGGEPLVLYPDRATLDKADGGRRLTGAGLGVHFTRIETTVKALPV